MSRSRPACGATGRAWIGVVAKERRQKREAFAALLEKGDYQGYITTEDIVTVFPDVEDAAERLERMLAFFRGAGIEVFDDPLQIPAHLRPEAKQADGPDAFDLSAISSDDTVGLYLKEMARVPLLTSEEEVDLATRIERGRRGEVRLARYNGNCPPKKRAELQGHNQILSSTICHFPYRCSINLVGNLLGHNRLLCCRR